MISILFWIALSARADVKGMIGNLNETVKQVGNGGGCANCSTHPQVGAMLVMPKINECLLQVCKLGGHSLAEVNFQIRMMAFRGMPDYDEKYGPLIDRITREEIRTGLDEDRGALDLLRRNPKISEPTAVAAFNLIRAAQDADDIKLKLLKDGSLVINEEDSREARKTLGDAKFKIASAVRLHQGRAALALPFESTDPGVLELVSSAEETRAKIDRTIAKIAEMKGEMLRDPNFRLLMSNPESSKELDPDVLRRSFPNGQYDTKSLENLNDQFVSISFIKNALSDPSLRKLLSAEPIDVAKYAREKDLEKSLNQRIEHRTRQLNSPNPYTEPSCQYAYALAKVGLPEKASLAAAKPAILALRDKFVERNKDLVCPAERADFEATAAKWSPTLSDSREDALKRFDDNMTEEMNSRKDERARFEALSRSEDRDSFTLFKLMSAASPIGLPSVFERCVSSTPNYFPDKSAFENEKFIVGPSVLADVEKNEGVPHHEMAHKMWTLFKNTKCPDKKAWFAKVRDCLRRNHTELTPEEIAADEERVAAGLPTRFESEDWADLVGERAESKSNNFACLFLSNPDQAARDQLSFRAAPSDDHSSELFRIMHLEFLKRGKLPEACREALAERGIKPNFKNCLQVPITTADGAQ